MTIEQMKYNFLGRKHKKVLQENFYKSLILKRRKPRSRISNSYSKPQNQIGIKTYPLLIQNIGNQIDEVGLWMVCHGK